MIITSLMECNDLRDDAERKLKQIALLEAVIREKDLVIAKDAQVINAKDNQIEYLKFGMNA